MTAIVVERAGAGVAAAPVSARRGVLRLGWVYAWPALLVISVYSRFGGTGLASPDDGFILAQSRRILSGQIPHRDFLSPRPAGSAVLHCIDFLLPLPLLSASRLISTVEVVAYTLVFAALAFRKPLREWSIVQVAAASAAVFVNLHSFPLMAWHTIDGVLFVGLGIVALHAGLEQRRVALSYTGLLLLGAALTVKQSFAPALVLGVVMVWEHRRRNGSETDRISPTRAAFVVALPMLAYVLVITAAGGLGPMIVQFSHAEPVFGWSLVNVLWWRGGQGSELIGCAAALCMIEARAGRSPKVRRFARLAARVGVSCMVVGVLLVTRTDPADAWGRMLLLLLVVVVAWEWFADGVVDRFGLVMIAVAWMTLLSWGYPSPRLVAGSVALVLLDRTWRGAPAVSGRVAAARIARTATLVGVAASFAVMATAIHERSLLNAAIVTDHSIADVVPDLRGVRADLSTATLIRDVAAFRARYPARVTAVLPGPAIVSPLMNLASPFSVDWVYSREVAGSEDRLVAEARRLDRGGGYLVLVAKVDPKARGAPNPVLDRMLNELTGVRSTCGAFVAIHSA